jgi:hypothetical protein
VQSPTARFMKNGLGQGSECCCWVGEQCRSCRLSGLS